MERLPRARGGVGTGWWRQGLERQEVPAGAADAGLNPRLALALPLPGMETLPLPAQKGLGLGNRRRWRRRGHGRPDFSPVAGDVGRV